MYFFRCGYSKTRRIRMYVWQEGAIWQSRRDLAQARTPRPAYFALHRPYKKHAGIQVSNNCMNDCLDEWFMNQNKTTTRTYIVSILTRMAPLKSWQRHHPRYNWSKIRSVHGHIWISKSFVDVIIHRGHKTSLLPPLEELQNWLSMVFS